MKEKSIEIMSAIVISVIIIFLLSCIKKKCREYILEKKELKNEYSYSGRS